MGGYRFVVALSPKYYFGEYLGCWNGWPKSLKRNILTEYFSQVVLGFNMTPTFVKTYEKFSEVNNVEENWQISH